MAASILLLHRIAIFFGCPIKYKPLILCAVMAFLVNFATLNISPFLTRMHYALILIFVLAASLGVTLYNAHLLKKDRLTASASIRGEPPADEQPAEAKEAEPSADEQPAEAKEAEPIADEQPAEAKEAEPPADEKPAEAEEAEPIADEQPAEAKEAEPPADEKPAEAKEAEPPADEKPAEAKEAEPSADEKPAEAEEAEPPADKQPTEAAKAEPVADEQPAEAEEAEPVANEQPAKAKEAEPSAEEKPAEAKEAEPIADEQPAEAKEAEPPADEQPAEAKKAAPPADEEDEEDLDLEPAVLPSEEERQRAKEELKELTEAVGRLHSMDDYLDYADKESRSHRLRRAVFAYKQALGIYWNDDYAPFIAINLGNTYKEMGEYEAASDTYETALSLPATQESPAMQQELRRSIDYLRTVRHILASHGIANMPLAQIPPEVSAEIESVIQEA